MAHPVSQDQAQGAMIGMALGDALGFLVAGQPPKYCKDFAAHALTDDEPPWLERDGYAFGQYTVDTQLARELALSMIEVRGFDPAHFAGRAALLFSARRALFAGEATSKAGERLARGMVWAQSGEPAPAAGNGAAIRAVPIGLSFKHAEHRGGAADMQASITHHDKRARAAAQIVAESVFLAATTEADAAWLPHLGGLVDRVDPRLANGLRNLVRPLAAPPDKALEQLIAAGHVPDDGYPAPRMISGFSTPTVLYALQVFLRAPDDPHLGLELALGGGGDTSSTAAYVGALYGARLGASGLSPRLLSWAVQLADHTGGHAEHGLDALRDIARRLVAR